MADRIIEEGATENFTGDDYNDIGLVGEIDPNYNPAGKKNALPKDAKDAIITAVTTAAINAIPMVLKRHKIRKNGLKPAVNGGEIAKFGLSTVVPVIDMVDKVFLGGKISEKIPLNHVRNVTNIVASYPSAYNVIQRHMSKNLARRQGVEVANSEADVENIVELTIKATTVVLPNVVNKMTDKNLTFAEKLGSAVPIPIVGQLVRKFFTSDPQRARVYDTVMSVAKVGSSTVNSLGGAVRANKNSTLNRGLSKTSQVMDIATTLLGGGASRGFTGPGTYNWTSDDRRANAYFAHTRPRQGNWMAY